jgi:glycosyltransferase involved in cell wall biosynthesis
MKILLLGEFSGLYKNLKDGLVELGHHAVIASNGDGFKKFPADISLGSTSSSLVGRIHRRVRPISLLSELRDYDVVQLVNPFLMCFKFFPVDHFYQRIIDNNDKFFISAAGDDAFFWRHGRQRLKYGPFDDSLKYDSKSKSNYLETESAYRFNKNLVENSNGIIPIMYEYEESYRSCSKRLKTIPIALNTNEIKYNRNSVGKKIIVFHGLNRYGFKGTRFVESAFSELARKYPNDLELIIRGKMPITDYLNLMNRANVVVDQVNSHSCGINGLYAMAMGKIVLGGSEPESLQSLGVLNSPVINISPCSSSIVHAIERIIANRSEIDLMGERSRLYVEKYHNHRKIAQQYIDLWRAH